MTFIGSYNLASELALVVVALVGLLARNTAR